MFVAADQMYYRLSQRWRNQHWSIKDIADATAYLHHSLLGILKALRNKVNGLQKKLCVRHLWKTRGYLMFCDWVFLQSSDLRVKCLQLRLSFIIKLNRFHSSQLTSCQAPERHHSSSPKEESRPAP